MVELKKNVLVVDFTPSHSVRFVPGVGNVLFQDRPRGLHVVGTHEGFELGKNSLPVARIKPLPQYAYLKIRKFLASTAAQAKRRR